MASRSAARPAWLTALAPYLERDDLRVELATPIALPIGTVVREVQGVSMRFPRWAGPPFADDFGKKSAGMVELDGEHLFAELAVLRLLEKEGWSGRWVNSYGAKGEVWKYLTEWRDLPRQEQRNRPIEEAEPRQLLARVASSRGGDTVPAKQAEWLRSALYLGDPRLKLDSFCFVQWAYR
jgi:hypothetical protein